MCSTRHKNFHMGRGNFEQVKGVGSGPCFKNKKESNAHFVLSAGIVGGEKESESTSKGENSFISSQNGCSSSHDECRPKVYLIHQAAMPGKRERRGLGDQFFRG